METLMTPAWIQFDPNLGLWSPFTFWVLIVSVVLTLGFTVAIFIGGIGDLRFLIRSLQDNERSKDENH